MPVRSCAACRGRFDKQELLRWVVDGEGCAVPDPRGRARGRGAYVCRREECWERLRKRKGGPDFRREERAFQLAIRGDVIQNVPGESHEN